MNVLASLSRAYERLADRGEVPPFGYSSEKIGFLVPLNEDGKPAGSPVDLREKAGTRLVGSLITVPQPVKRTSGVAPNFLWDKTSYVLGVTAGVGRRTTDEHAAFVARHVEELGTSDDPGLRALLRFIETWTPEQFVALGWPEEMKDQNVVFALESERRSNINIHDRPAARALWAQITTRRGDRAEAVCLVSGDRAPIARLHPSIKGVWDAQTAGASIVSFNLDAFASYGHEQGDNAPVSEAAAFAYTTALNKFLERDSRNRIQVGDASTVFWADAFDADVAAESEALFGALLADMPIDETKEAGKIRTALEKIRAGRPIAEAAPELATGVRFFVLGLSPNAARLSVRFWLEDDFGTIAERFARHLEAMRIEPPPKDENPSIWRCLIETAVQRKSENIPPNLAGEWLRAILTGTSYPLTLLATVLMRLRADEQNDEEAIALRRFMCDNFFDVRSFGAVMSTGINCGQVRGPVQLSFARSIEPVVPLEISITRMAATTTDEKSKREEGADEDVRRENRTMGRKHIVPYGLYRAHGFVSAKLAERTGFSTDDLTFLWEALANMFEHDHSAARGEMTARRLITFKHGSALGNAPSHLLFDRVTVGRAAGDDIRLPGDPRLDNLPPARRFTDYRVEVNRKGLPEKVEILDLI
jgi:CRISPR-associated protein Csd1